ncbi:hypothetical protein SNE40_012441 [Patella caerulea]|uniref:EF-hand domain-containing protein n=1 Tax=Patella caerulea TaxID=87958 RepID=A0AAN8PQL6_PATCE
MFTCVCFLFIVLVGNGEGTTSFKPLSGSIDTLIHLREMFHREDIDDNGIIEYTDARETDIRVDANHDGVYTQEEFDADPDLSGYNQRREWIQLDVNNDGIITHEDTKLIFFLGPPQYNLEQFLEFFANQRSPRRGEITVKSFVLAEENFRLTDINDNGLVSEREFTSVFRVADYNHDGVLQNLELNRYRPLQNVPVNEYCSDVTAGCMVEDFLVMFKESDVNNDGTLGLKEFLVTFGTLMDSTV